MAELGPLCDSCLNDVGFEKPPQWIVRDATPTSLIWLDGKVAFTQFIIQDNVRGYHAEIPKAPIQITDREKWNAMQRIPDHEIYPVAGGHMNYGDYSDYPDDLADTDASECTTLRQPRVVERYGPLVGTDELARRWETEINFCEFLTQHQHPNIGLYLGGIFERGRIVATAMGDPGRHGVFRMVRPAKPPPLDVEKWLAGIESAVKHLHSLGYAHNNLRPDLDHIVAGRGKTPYICDFEFCRPFGSHFAVRGTAFVSDPKHDLAALQKLRKYYTRKLQGAPDSCLVRFQDGPDMEVAVLAPSEAQAAEAAAAYRTTLLAQTAVTS